MEFKPNDQSITSESAPLIEPVDCDSDQDLFMVPLKRPSPRPQHSRYRNEKAGSSPRFPAAPLSPSNPEKSPQPQSQLGPSSYQSPAMSGRTIKPDSPPMFTSPLMSPESGVLGLDGVLSGHGSSGQRSMATPGSLAYNSPPMSGRATRVGSSPIMSTEAGSAQSPQPGQSSSKDNTTSASRSTGDKRSPSTKASSVYDGPPAIVEEKVDADADADADGTQQAPELPPLSAARALRNANKPSAETSTKARNLGLALHLASSNSNNNNSLNNPNDPNLLAPPTPGGKTAGGLRSPSAAGGGGWTVPDSPLERLSQLRATPDSAYDRARQMEIRRSEWKHVVYRFPVKGREHWVIDADLTESSHARLADVARRSSEGFEWNGDYELANIYCVLAVAHGKVMEDMRGERRGAASTRA